ncbi:uncharacterized protein RAG0_02817 [Rhynchosporium agropyri]|uniref:Uncharacterized protein n=1 Tax=Rhynchosporium agropyri TaxID=914238 RepID=A0A1E1K2V7_9HELO|nr:uncharacterized protein RAG0_02817 [Rhynchosporium agropyri]
MATLEGETYSFWVKQTYHFGITVPSPVESCHATLKLYLQRRHADLKRCILQITALLERSIYRHSINIAQQQLGPRHTTNIPLLATALPFVHSRALQIIILQYSKLIASGPPPNSCLCTTNQAFGLPCFYTIRKRQQEGGSVLLGDIHHHWYYNSPESTKSAPPAFLHDHHNIFLTS